MIQHKQFEPSALAASAHLRDHNQLLLKIFDFFQAIPEIKGAFVSGSTATGNMDEFSDLDVGFLVSDQRSRDQLWQKRWDWDIAPWFHRFDADHVKPYFVIYFFEPSIHVDLNFYVESDLPSFAGAPYVKAWGDDSAFEKWLAQVNSAPPTSIDWNTLVHDDERFWAWIHYSCSHALRGEYYDSASFMKDLRKIVENWHAKLNGATAFDSRKAESRWSSNFISQMNKTFASPEPASVASAFRTLIKIQLEQRRILSDTKNMRWRTSDSTIEKISGMVNQLKDAALETGSVCS